MLWQPFFCPVPNWHTCRITLRFNILEGLSSREKNKEPLVFSFLMGEVPFQTALKVPVTFDVAFLFPDLRWWPVKMLKVVLVHCTCHLHLDLEVFTACAHDFFFPLTCCCYTCPLCLDESCGHIWRIHFRCVSMFFLPPFNISCLFVFLNVTQTRICRKV